jgi:hypothetical protein
VFTIHRHFEIITKVINNQFNINKKKKKGEGGVSLKGGVSFYFYVLQ